MLARGLTAQATVLRHLTYQLNHVLQGRVGRAQHIQFLLGKVANGQTLAFNHLTMNRGEGACQGLHQGRFTLTIGTQNTHTLTCQHRLFDVFHNHQRLRRVIAAAHVLQRQHGVGQVGRLLKFKREVGLSQHRCNFFHAFQGFDPALCLLGFAGLGLEPVNKLLQVGNLVFLTRKSRLLLFQLLCPHILKTAVIAAITFELSPFNVNRCPRDCVKKFPVMADDQHGAFVLLQPCFQPHQGIQVQVVGGFVQQQQI